VAIGSWFFRDSGAPDPGFELPDPGSEVSFVGIDWLRGGKKVDQIDDFGYHFFRDIGLL
jgi:hypothetical protein